MKENRLEFCPPSMLVTFLRSLALLGGATVDFGLAFAPERIWSNLLLAAIFLLGVGLEGVAFVALQ